MDFSRANSILEEVQDDLTAGLLGNALEKLSDVLEMEPGKVISFNSIAQVEPKDKKSPPKGEPMTFKFKSIPKRGQIQAEKKRQVESGDDSPEDLGNFLHRNFGHKKWDHKKAMKVAAKAHGKPQDFARATADHYIRLSREAEKKQESVKVKQQYFRQQWRKKQAQEGIFDLFKSKTPKPSISSEPRSAPSSDTTTPNRRELKRRAADGYREGLDPKDVALSKSQPGDDAPKRGEPDLRMKDPFGRVIGKWTGKWTGKTDPKKEEDETDSPKKPGLIKKAAKGAFNLAKKNVGNTFKELEKDKGRLKRLGVALATGGASEKLGVGKTWTDGS